jgi:hypothetical protein
MLSTIVSFAFFRMKFQVSLRGPNSDLRLEACKQFESLAVTRKDRKQPIQLALGTFEETVLDKEFDEHDPEIGVVRIEFDRCLHFGLRLMPLSFVE